MVTVSWLVLALIVVAAGAVGMFISTYLIASEEDEVEQLVCSIHCLVKRGSDTQDHGVLGNLRCILDHIVDDRHEPVI